MQFPITIGLRRSFLLGVLISFAHLAALTVIAIAMPSWAWKLLNLALLISLAVSSWRWWRMPADSLHLEADGRLSVRLHGDDSHTGAELLSGTLAHPWLTVLRLRCQGRVITVTVAADSAMADDRRRLRLWLRWVPKPTGSASDVL